ncbi:hypothetical protein FHS18_005632 [Paenibacillus phyllosphaerae]|uniref:Uncharacterized protein n=1 Tax=Paenibacillus phyllosphaerae TaxID=274593 RepID=A0A7W5B325_9BACL|nr:hypothetical protein [Paenibacillus phyllosphaerae]MBB3113520.1 hypothetical protein [Paenibacillus phyllosphaerae]
MAQLTLRPDMKTHGGEVYDILLQDKFAGNLMLVYREGDRVAGSAQLDATVLHEEDQDEVLAFLKDHLHAFGNAVNAQYSEMIVTYSSYDHIFSFGDEDEAQLHTTSDSIDSEFDEYDEDEDDTADEEWEYELLSEDDDMNYELVVVDEEQESAEYEVYDNAGSCVAFINLAVQENAVEGQVHWLLEPEDDAITHITELLLQEFDEDAVDAFTIYHRYEGRVIETAEFVQDGELDEDEDSEDDWQSPDPYQIVLVRDDVDALTYEIFSPYDSNLPIAHATVDIGQRRLSGFIDFRERELIDDAAEISIYLMRELDKEKDYDGLSLSLMHRNELVDELVIQNEVT